MKLKLLLLLALQNNFCESIQEKVKQLSIVLLSVLKEHKRYGAAFICAGIYVGIKKFKKKFRDTLHKEKLDQKNNLLLDLNNKKAEIEKINNLYTIVNQYENILNPFQARIKTLFFKIQLSPEKNIGTIEKEIKTLYYNELLFLIQAHCNKIFESKEKISKEYFEMQPVWNETKNYLEKFIFENQLLLPHKKALEELFSGLFFENEREEKKDLEDKYEKKLSKTQQTKSSMHFIILSLFYQEYNARLFLIKRDSTENPEQELKSLFAYLIKKYFPEEESR